MAAASPLTEFAAAVAVFEQGHWREAGRHFARALASDPSDGPARFYQERRERYLTGTPPPAPVSPCWSRDRSKDAKDLGLSNNL